MKNAFAPDRQLVALKSGLVANEVGFQLERSSLLRYGKVMISPPRMISDKISCDQIMIARIARRYENTSAPTAHQALTYV